MYLNLHGIGMMGMFKNILILWHRSQLKYHKGLMKGCQDEKLREKSIEMLEYHSNKINELNMKNGLTQEQ